MSNNLWTERIYNMSETEIFERQSNKRQSATNNLSFIKLQKNPALFQNKRKVWPIDVSANERLMLNNLLQSRQCQRCERFIGQMFFFDTTVMLWTGPFVWATLCQYQIQRNCVVRAITLCRLQAQLEPAAWHNSSGWYLAEIWKSYCLFHMEWRYLYLTILKLLIFLSLKFDTTRHGRCNVYRLRSSLQKSS